MNLDYQFNIDAFDAVASKMSMVELGAAMRLLHIQNSGKAITSDQSEIATMLGIDPFLVPSILITLSKLGITEWEGEFLRVHPGSLGITLV